MPAEAKNDGKHLSFLQGGLLAGLVEISRKLQPGAKSGDLRLSLSNPRRRKRFGSLVVRILDQRRWSNAMLQTSKHAASNRQMVYGFFVQSRARPIIVIVDHVGSSGGVEEIDDCYDANPRDDFLFQLCPVADRL